MKRLILACILLIIVLDLSAQFYRFDSIPDNLKRGADAVVRTHQSVFTLIKPGNAIHREKKVVTLLNDNADGFREIEVPYNKFSKVKFLRGAVYDEKGDVVKTLGALDILDRSAVAGGLFYSDYRVKSLTSPVYKYPYTIEYEYEEELFSLINYPEWEFQESYDVSVERSGIQIVVPKGTAFRYFTRELKYPLDSVIQENVTIYTWQEENIPARKERQYTYEEFRRPPSLYTAPMDFEYGGYKGSMSSWKSFGEWNYNLINGRDLLPEEQKQKVAEIVSKAKSEREKVKLIYEYMQSTTRYVLIYIGIGGFQPAEASAVAKSGFGDCKALVNYTKSLLKAAGINSYYTLVTSGDDEATRIKKDFVINNFNHVILSVPMEKDTVWLECTDQTIPFNYLGHTTDRYALMITPDGGKLVKTLAFGKEENVFRRTGTVSLNNFGKSSLKLSDYYSGTGFSVASRQFRLESEEEMIKYLNSSLRFSDINTASVKYLENKSEKPSAVFAYETNVNDFAVLSGRMLIFDPSFDKVQYLQDLPASIEIYDNNITSDSITFSLPHGFKVESRPADVFIENEFGKFRYQLESENDKLIYKRYLQMNKGVIPVEKFGEFRSFINSIAKTDREKVILSN
jgi:transglutaminase-like putative cysteine protease